MSPISKPIPSKPNIRKLKSLATVENKETMESPGPFPSFNPSIIDPSSLDSSLRPLSINDSNNFGSNLSTIISSNLPRRVFFNDTYLDALVKGFKRANDFTSIRGFCQC
ncbi:hypothetical protein EAF04_010130 [Stromatinia cepivora]|nr:hypothetical protein EAF04_010130 [Stromatinia cepivora]